MRSLGSIGELAKRYVRVARLQLVEVDSIGRQHSRRAEAGRLQGFGFLRRRGMQPGRGFDIPPLDQPKGNGLSATTDRHRLALQHPSRGNDVGHARAASEARGVPDRQIPQSVNVDQVVRARSPAPAPVAAPARSRVGAARRAENIARVRLRTRSVRSPGGSSASDPRAVVVITSTSTPHLGSSLHSPRMLRGGPPYANAGAKYGETCRHAKSRHHARKGCGGWSASAAASARACCLKNLISRKRSRMTTGTPR